MPRKIVTALCGGIALLAACGTQDRPNVVRSGSSEVSATAASDTARPENEPESRPVILFLGTSLTAGYGVPADSAYPARVQARLDSMGLDYRVVNAGVSGETSAGGLRRIDRLLRHRVEVLVLELGANDMLRGQDLEAMRSNLQEIVDRTRSRRPDARIVIAGLRAPPNMGERYGQQFAEVYHALARRNDATLIPFLLEGVAADPELNLADGIHPNVSGHRIMAETVWRVLAPILEGRNE